MTDDLSGGLGADVAGRSPAQLVAGRDGSAVAPGTSVLLVTSSGGVGGRSLDGKARSEISPPPISVGFPLAAVGPWAGGAGCTPGSTVSSAVCSRHTGYGALWPGWTPEPTATIAVGALGGELADTPSSTVSSAAGSCARHTGEGVFEEPLAASAAAAARGGTLSAWAPEYGGEVRWWPARRGLGFMLGQRGLSAWAPEYCGAAVRAQTRPVLTSGYLREAVSPVSRRADSVRPAQQDQGSLLESRNFGPVVHCERQTLAALTSTRAPVEAADAGVRARHRPPLSRAYPSNAAVSYSSTKYAQAERVTPIWPHASHCETREPVRRLSARMGTRVGLVPHPIDFPDSRELRDSGLDGGPGITIEDDWVQPSHFGRPISADYARASTLPPVQRAERYAALEEETATDGGPGGPVRPPFSCGGGARVFRRVAGEVRNWYRSRRGRLPKEPPEYAHQARTAGDYKLLIYEYCDPTIGGDISVPCPKVPFRAYSRDAFWDQIALSRLRFQGSKGTFAVCHAGQRRGRLKDGEQRRRVLVLHSPDHCVGGAMGGGGDNPGGYDERHAARQATFHDDADGVFERGRRVHLKALAQAGVPEDEMERLRKGYDLVLKWWPKQYHGKHYGGAVEYPDKLQTEHERMLARGFVEGPLLYVPWIVQSLGGVWKMDKEKWRTIVDATSSGVNPACVPLECRYDMLTDAVKGMKPGCRLSSFDLTDAFLN